MSLTMGLPMPGSPGRDRPAALADTTPAYPPLPWPCSSPGQHRVVHSPPLATSIGQTRHLTRAAALQKAKPLLPMQQRQSMHDTDEMHAGAEAPQSRGPRFDAGRDHGGEMGVVTSPPRRAAAAAGTGSPRRSWRAAAWDSLRTHPCCQKMLVWTFDTFHCDECGLSTHSIVILCCSEKQHPHIVPD